MYVNSAGDTIYILDGQNGRVMKWMVNATSGILVAGGSPSNPLEASAFGVDEINHIVYIVGVSSHRLMKFSNGSANGTMILGGGPQKPFSNVLTEYIGPMSVLVDKTSNIIVGEWERISMWTPDLKFHLVIAGIEYDLINSPSTPIFQPVRLKSDRKDNLYAFQGNTLLKFNRIIPTCPH